LRSPASPRRWLAHRDATDVVGRHRPDQHRRKIDRFIGHAEVAEGLDGVEELLGDVI
jgi:hypothetical protein